VIIRLVPGIASANSSAWKKRLRTSQFSATTIRFRNDVAEGESLFSRSRGTGDDGTIGCHCLLANEAETLDRVSGDDYCLTFDVELVGIG
jgi:hypothetical protein